MTDEQINQRIAEACGWGWFQEIWTGELLGKPIREQGPLRSIPDYCNDLNAMHEAEKVLADNQFMRYSRWIESFMQSPHYRSYLSATARHRAEAFLRTLGKWEEAQK